MKSKKKRISQLNIILDEPLPAISLEKIIGSASSEVPPILDKSALTEETSLDVILNKLEALEDDDAMDAFINKYGSDTFRSLDDLLAAHLSNPYDLKVKASSNDKLFEGLESILGE